MLRAAGQGSLDGLQIEQGRLDSGRAVVRVTGSLDWLGNLNLQSSLELAQSEFEAESRLIAVADDEALEASLQWSEFSWPLDATTPSFTSPSGSAQLAGRLEEWSMEARAVLETPDYVGGAFELTGNGDLEHAALTIRHGEALGGATGR